MWIRGWYGKLWHRRAESKIGCLVYTECGRPLSGWKLLYSADPPEGECCKRCPKKGVER